MFCVDIQWLGISNVWTYYGRAFLHNYVSCFKLHVAEDYLYSPVKHGWTYRGKAFPVSVSRLRNFAGGHTGGRCSVN